MVKLYGFCTSVPSLHRESTDSLSEELSGLVTTLVVCMPNGHPMLFVELAEGVHYLMRLQV